MYGNTKDIIVKEVPLAIIERRSNRGGCDFSSQTSRFFADCAELTCLSITKIQIKKSSILLSVMLA